MRNVLLIMLLICVIIVILPSKVEGKSLQDVLVNRASFLSKLQVRWDRALESPQHRPTEGQIVNRVSSIMKYAKEFNHMAPELYWRDTVLDIYAIMAVETGFVNYRSLDKGDSFGTGSMQWETAKELLEGLSEAYARWELGSDTKLQIKLVVYNYYKKYNHFNSRELAIVSYNQGFSVDAETQRYEHYFFQVNGRVEYIKNNLL